jgi:hypothetical protein
MSKSGIHSKPDICLGFSDAALGCSLLLPGCAQQKKTDAMKPWISLPAKLSGSSGTMARVPS